MTVQKILEKGKTKAISNGKEESSALLLLEYALNMTSHELYIHMNDKVSIDIEKKYFDLLDEYIFKNVPVQYIVGFQYFYGYEFNVDENVLIPRYETEELVENVLYRYDQYFSGERVKLVDVGTGSGCIGITLALEEKNMDVTITDISSDALEVAKSNILKLGVNVRVLQGDMLEPLKGMKFDILVSNPPYIPNEEEVMSLVKDNEPNLALFGGEDGLKFYRIILSNCETILNPKALVAFEHAYDKGEEMRKLCLTYFPKAKVETIKDMQGLDRMTIMYKEQ